MKMITAGPLVALVHEGVERGINGLLANPPRLFALHYSDQYDRIEVTPVSWEAVAALAPEKLQVMSDALRDERDRVAKVAKE